MLYEDEFFYKFFVGSEHSRSLVAVFPILEPRSRQATGEFPVTWIYLQHYPTVADGIYTTLVLVSYGIWRDHV
jgi:hypothetical protein